MPSQLRRISIVLLCFLPALLWMAFIFILSNNPDPPAPRFGSELLDLVVRKTGHFAEYALLALLLYLPLRPRPRGVWLALLLASLYASTDELHQTFIPLRNGNAIDWLIDSSGAALALWLYRRVVVIGK